MNAVARLPAALQTPVLGALLPAIELNGLSSPTQAIQSAIAQWAPGATIRSLRFAGAPESTVNALVINASIYGICRSNVSELVLQLKARASDGIEFSATASLRMPA